MDFAEESVLKSIVSPDIDFAMSVSRLVMNKRNPTNVPIPKGAGLGYWETLVAIHSPRPDRIVAHGHSCRSRLNFISVILHHEAIIVVHRYKLMGINYEAEIEYLRALKMGLK
jgi:hypothetical protein